MPRHLVTRLALALIASPVLADDYAATVLYPLAGGPYWGYFGSAFSAHTEFPCGQAAAGGQVVGGWNDGGVESHAALWTDHGIPVDLSPGAGNSYAYSTDGAQQVGYAGDTAPRAALWSGSAASAVGLHPSTFATSAAIGVRGGQQVGYGQQAPGGQIRALLWSGTAESARDLHPAAAALSQAWNTDGVHQVGYARMGGGDTPHATLWSGTAASAVDLHPAGFDRSYAQGVGGPQQVGWGWRTGGYFHALLWNGTAGSAVDLHPSGWIGSYAFATNGSRQAGYAEGAGVWHAMVWSGTAASAIDLHTAPVGGGWSFGPSQAFSIDASGNIFGVAYAYGLAYEGLVAVRWSPVPAPAAAALFSVALPIALGRRKRS